MPAEQDFSIIIVNWETRELLRKCLESVRKYGAWAETIVVDNGSGDSSAEMIREAYKWVRLIENNENLGFARAINQGIRVSTGEYILLLNSDAELTAGALEEMIGCMNQESKIGICGPRLVYPDGQEQKSHGNLPRLRDEIWGLMGFSNMLPTLWRKSGEKPHSSSYKSVVETGILSGASMMVRRSVLDDVGCLDERYFMFSEEIDLCKRAREAGWKVVLVSTAVVIHLGGGSTGFTSRRVLQLYKGKLQYFEKHAGHGARVALWVAMWITSWIKSGIYFILRLMNIRSENKAGIWLEVGKGIGDLWKNPITRD